VFPFINILNHASYVYIIKAFLMFEKFIDSAAYKCKEAQSSTCDMLFEVWGVRIANESHGDESYNFKHIISFNNKRGCTEFGCKKFMVVGIL